MNENQEKELDVRIINGEDPAEVFADAGVERAEDPVTPEVQQEVPSVEPELPTEEPAPKPEVPTTTPGKSKVGAVARLIALVVAIINQFCAIFGLYTIPSMDESGTNLVALGITIVAAGFAYWSNNSWTANASVCDNILAMLNAHDISIADILELLAEASRKKTEEESKADKE